MLLTRWNTCSLLISVNRALRSLTRLEMFSNLPLSVDSISLVSPMTMSRVRRMPPFGEPTESQPDRPDVEMGLKQSLWSPASEEEKVNFPEESPFWVKTR